MMCRAASLCVIDQRFVTQNQGPTPPSEQNDFGHIRHIMWRATKWAKITAAAL